MSSVGETFSNRPATLADYLAILRRRKWILMALPAIAAVVAYATSTTQPSRYEAQVEVLFRLSSIPAQLANVAPSSTDATYLPTQASIARSAELAQRVVDASGVPGMTAGQFLGQSGASARADANILDLSASASTSANASRLANTYAEEFTRYKAQLDTAPIRSQIRRYEVKIERLRAKGETGSAEALFAKKIDLETLGEQLANNASVLPHEDSATKTQPRPRRNAILGGLLGLVLGLGLAFLAEALDKRVQSEREIEEELGLPLLGRLPRPGRRLRKANNLVMLSEPRSIHSETIRKLRTSLEFVNFDRSARTIMVTSAGPREGKSTTVANLAVALARAGRRVVLVDLDLRRPFLHSFFHVRGDHGLTDVVVNRVELNDAIRPLALPAGAVFGKSETRNGRPSASSEVTGSNGRSEAEGVLHLLPCGTIPPAADEFLERERVSSILEDLSNEFDLVLVDAPPLLAVSDVMTLSTKVDAMLVVTHLGIHRRQLRELARQLQNCKASILGFVLTGVSHGDSYSYGYGYDPHVYDARQEAERRGERV